MSSDGATVLVAASTRPLGIGAGLFAILLVTAFAAIIALLGSRTRRPG
jgi:hypothetical protein